MSFVPPLLAESRGDPSAYVPIRGDITTRVKRQSFDYDWMGNLTRSGDDADAFWDRSIGTATMGGSTGPNRLMHSQSGAGSLDVTYDASGNVASIDVTRSPGKCAERGICSNRFIYDWDEVGQLAHARRFDFTLGAPRRVRVCEPQDPIDPGELPRGHKPPKPPPPVCHWEITPGIPIAAPTDDAELSFVYDGSGTRVLKKVMHSNTLSSVNAEIFPTLRLDHTTWDGTDYDRSATTESVYLAGGLGRVLYAPSGVPTNGGGPLHVLLEVGNHLGSTSIVIDKETSEVVERVTYQAYGATESDYRPERWQHFRETYRLTGKEEDLDVGLTYFGARYYVAALGRWASADPLTIHGLGADLNPYAYVSGSPLSSIDPDGLDELGDGAGTWSVPNSGGPSVVIDLGTIYGSVPNAGYVPSTLRGDEVNVSDAMPLEDDSVLHVDPRAKGLFSFSESTLKGMEAIHSGNFSFSGDDYGRNLWNTFIDKTAYGSVSSLTIVPIPSFSSAVSDWITSSLHMDTAPTFNGGTLNLSGMLASGTYLGAEIAATAGAAGLGNAAKGLYPEGTFSITKAGWAGYPGGVRPSPGTVFRILEGSEYDAARSAASRANDVLRSLNRPAFQGTQIHEIHPVKFGGSPTDLANKMVTPTPLHYQYTTWWNQLMNDLGH